MNNGEHASIFEDNNSVVFEPASWLIKIDFINQFILNNNVLISVLGEQGSGKTTFAHLVENKLDASVKTALLTAMVLFDRDSFLAKMCSLLNLETKASVADIAAEVNEKKSHTLVIIDDANQLPEMFVKELLDTIKQIEGQNYFHVCLLSDFSLVKMTSRLARDCYKDMIHSIELQPLTFSETKAYIQEKMTLTKHQIPLTDECLKQFYELTEGNIVGINTQMLGFFSQVAQRPRLRFEKSALLYGLVPVVLGGVIWGWSALFSQPEAVSTLTEQLANNSIQSVALDLPLTSEIPQYQLAAIQQPVQMVSLQKAELAVNTPKSESAVDDSLVLMDKVVSIPKVVMPSVSGSVSGSVVPVSTVAMERNPVSMAVKTVGHSSAKPINVAKQAKRQPKFAAVAHATLPMSFTIQLLSSRDKEKILRLARQYAKAGDVKMRRFHHQGDNWYVLTVGQYAERQQAAQAMAKLAKKVASFKPWIRPLSDLHDVG